ncbi:MAG: hypothetical protein V1905_01710 [bacterium]
MRQDKLRLGEEVEPEKPVTEETSAVEVTPEEPKEETPEKPAE